MDDESIPVGRLLSGVYILRTETGKALKRM
jgi:hypothetical protein